MKTNTQFRKDAHRNGTSNIGPTANSKTAMLNGIELGCSDDPRQEACKYRKGGWQSFIGFASVAAVFSFLLLGCSSHRPAPSDQAFVSQDALPELPIARGSLVLEAMNDPHSGKGSFSYEAHEIPPVIHISPGETLQINYRNHMSPHSTEQCASGPCMNMTNLHFHRLHVSPESPQDDTISMMATPGESIQYRVDIPLDQPPGLYWYHESSYARITQAGSPLQSYSTRTAERQPGGQRRPATKWKAAYAITVLNHRRVCNRKKSGTFHGSGASRKSEACS